MRRQALQQYRLLRQLIAAGNEDDVLDLISSIVARVWRPLTRQRPREATTGAVTPGRQPLLGGLEGVERRRLEKVSRGRGAWCGGKMGLGPRLAPLARLAASCECRKTAEVDSGVASAGVAVRVVAETANASR